MPRAVTVAIISDTHGFLDPRIVTLIRDCDCAVHAGDVMATAVLDAMNPRTGTVIAVAGNNDTSTQWNPSGMKVADRLPRSAELELPGGTLAVEHGHRYTHAATRHVQLRRAYPHARIIVYGHSHKLTCDQEQLPWIVNPGAAGRARTYGGPSCLVLAATQNAWRVEPFRFPPLRSPPDKRERSIRGHWPDRR